MEKTEPRWRDLSPELRGYVRELLDSFVRMHAEVNQRTRGPWVIHTALVAARAELFPDYLVCRHCPSARPATCIGAYHGENPPTPTCDHCCGHSQEDGTCRPVTEKDQPR